MLRKTGKPCPAYTNLFRVFQDVAAVFSVSIFTGLFRVESNFSLVIAGIIYHIILYFVVGFFIRTTAKRGTLVVQGAQIPRGLNY